MSDNITSNYLDSRKARAGKEREALLSELDEMMAEEAAPKAAAPAATAPTAKKAEAPGTSVGTALQDTASSVIYAGAGLVDSVGGMVNDAVNVFTSNMFDYRFASPDLTGAIEGMGLSKPQTIGGKLSKEILQWATPYAAALKATSAAKATTKMGEFGRSMAAGAIADVSAFGPDEKRLSDMLIQLSDANPWLRNPVTEFLSSQEGDTHAESRLKNVLEGAGLGAAVEGVFHLLRATRGVFGSKGVDAKKILDESEKEVTETATKEAAAGKPQAPTTMQERINKLTGVKPEAGADRWQKRLDVLAAAKEADAKAAAEAAAKDAPTPKAEVKPGYQPDLMKAADDAGVEAVTPSRPLTFEERNADLIRSTMEGYEKAVSKGAASHKLMFDSADGTMSLSKDAPSETQIDMDEVANKILEPGYIQDLLKVADEAGVEAVTPSRPLTQAEKNDQLIRKQMTEFLDAYKELQDRALGKTPEAPKAEAKPRTDTPYDPKLADTAKDVPVQTPSRPLSQAEKNEVKIKEAMAKYEAIKSNNELLAKAAGKQQGGFISPSLLAHLAAAQVGAVAGFMSADDDATLADKLSMAGFGALAGFGLVKVGAEKLVSREQAKAMAKQAEEVAAIANPQYRNVAPAALKKKAPVIAKDKVDKLVEVAKTGNFEKLAEAARASDFNFDNIDSPEEVKTMIDAFSSVFEKEIDKAKHGTQSNNMLKSLAEEIGAGVSSLKNLYQDTDNLGARIFAHRALLVASAEKVNVLARDVAQGALTPAARDQAILSLRKHVALHASIQGQMKGVQTEVARALAQFRIGVTSVDLAVNERNMLIEAMGGHKANVEFAEKLSAISDPKRLNGVIRKAAMARTQDALYEAWVNGLLSGPVTHAVNTVGNGLVAIATSAERMSAAMIGKVLKTENAVEMGEATAHMYGMVEGMLDALKLTKHGMDALKQATGSAIRGDFKAADQIIRENSGEFGNAFHAFATDMPVLDNAAYGTREFDMQSAAISADNLMPTKGMASDMIDSLNMRKQLEVFTDVLGTVVRTPGRMLTTGDELFKTMHYRGELKAQAYRMAKAQGLEGEKAVEFISKMIDDPTPELRAQALQAAREGTFTSPLGKGGSLMQGAVHATPGARYILPFIRTPVNIMKFIGVRTPVLNMMAESVRAEFKAGGVRRDMMMAKTVTGGMLYATGAYLAAQGLIVGGGEKDKSAEKLGGITPYSIKIGDTYYAFNRLDPFGMFLGLAADFSTMSGQMKQGQTDELASAAVLAISRNLVSKSYLSGLINLIEAVTDPDRYGEKFIQNFAASFTPFSALTNTVRKEVDPVVREVWSIADAFQNKLPGFSDDLPPHLNIFGEEVKYTGGLGPDIVSPIRTSDATTDIAASEIARLNVDLRHPPKRVGGGNGSPGIDLDSKQYHRLMQLLGETFKPAILNLVQSDMYKKLPEDPSGSLYVEAKEMVIRKLYEAHKQAAVNKLLKETPELLELFIQDKKNAGNVLMGLPINQ